MHALGFAKPEYADWALAFRKCLSKPDIVLRSAKYRKEWVLHPNPPISAPHKKLLKGKPFLQ